MKMPESVSTAFARYTIKGVIGEGGSGIVYRAEDEDGSAYAIKFLDSGKATSDKRKRFKNELQFGANNNHKNIVKVVDSGISQDGSPFFVMPLYDSSLRKAIPGLSPESALQVFGKILDGIEAAHLKGVVHRDIKPENILVSADLATIVLADFGIARFEEEDLFTAIETRDGTRLANYVYSAPEQRIRGREVDLRADIYAAGLLLNELFTGEAPHGTNYKTIGSVSSRFGYLDQIVERMIAQSPSDRYQSIEEIKKELIARGEEYISRQKLSQLEREVIPAGAIDDPIANDPVRIVSVDWNDGVLTLELSHAVSGTWQWASQNMGSYQSLLGKGPESFRYIGNKATISAASQDSQRIIDHFKQWLPRIHQVYVNRLKDDLEKEEAQRRKQHADVLRKQQEKVNLLAKLKF